MNKWMDGWMDRWMNKFNGWMNGWMNEIDNSMNGWMDGWMDGWMNQWVNHWANEWIIEWMNEWMNVAWMIFTIIIIIVIITNWNNHHHHYSSNNIINKTPSDQHITIQTTQYITAKIIASRPRSFAWDFVLFCDSGYYSEIIPKLHLFNRICFIKIYFWSYIRYFSILFLMFRSGISSRKT